ncbi:hypothetical protein F5Y16DRAFT_11487 [Xylariaceae sp. FL0255]|nr:hypothetical protein F5Y16DRAFT_11487 [Xylariaceae sp. FL0255]
MFGFPLCAPFGSNPSPSSAQAEPCDFIKTAAMLNQDDLLERKFEKIMSPNFKPLTEYHTRERIVVVLGMLAMQTGAILTDEHKAALRALRRLLPNVEQQAQLLAAVEGYKNDGVTPWISGSKTFAEVEASRAKEKNEGAVTGEAEDEFWFGGLGHSIDQLPTANMQTVSCLCCGETACRLYCCLQCKIARFCSKECQKIEWENHKGLCQLREKTRHCPIPEGIREKLNKTLRHDETTAGEKEDLPISFQVLPEFME